MLLILLVDSISSPTVSYTHLFCVASVNDKNIPVYRHFTEVCPILLYGCLLYASHIALPYDMVCAASVDELNFLASRIEQLDPAEIGKLNAALQQKNGFENIGQVIDFTYNVDFYVHIPEVHTYRDLGDYYLNQSGMVQMPEEWKGGIDLTAFGRNAAEQEKGAFAEYGYIVESGDEWERQFEGREVPEEYRIMSCLLYTSRCV